MTIRLVVFDVGETLVDESRTWGLWADWLGVSRLALFAALGATIARGEHHRQAFQRVRPGFDLARERDRRRAAGWPDDVFSLDDLYPDALPCLRELLARGLRIGLAGNQPVEAESVIASLGIPLDLIASSARWGVEKPSPAFFARIAAESRLAPAEIAYVGDRVDNDVVPAANAGMLAVFLRRGPWGVLQSEWPDASRAALRIDDLASLPDALAALEL